MQFDCFVVLAEAAQLQLFIVYNTFLPGRWWKIPLYFNYLCIYLFVCVYVLTWLHLFDHKYNKNRNIICVKYYHNITCFFFIPLMKKLLCITQVTWSFRNYSNERKHFVLSSQLCCLKVLFFFFCQLCCIFFRFLWYNRKFKSTLFFNTICLYINLHACLFSFQFRCLWV